MKLSCSFVVDVKVDMLQGPWFLVNFAKCVQTFSYLDMPRRIKLLSSASINYETVDCNPKFQLEMGYGERLGVVTGVRHFFIGTHISLHNTNDDTENYSRVVLLLRYPS